MYLLLSNVDSDLIKVLENLDVNQNLSIYKSKQPSRSSRDRLPPGYMGMLILEPPLYDVVLKISEAALAVVLNLLSSAIYKHFEDNSQKPIKINGRYLLEEELKNKKLLNQILEEKLKDKKLLNQILEEKLKGQKLLNDLNNDNDN